MNDLSVIQAEFGDLTPYMQAPAFWAATPQRAMPIMDQFRGAAIRTIGHSAGGREILAIEYGEKEDIEAETDNLQSAMAAKIVPVDITDIYPASFFGRRRRRRPVLMLQGAIHGGEITGSVACINLGQIIETGQDLRGKPWPRLQELAARSRIVMVPWLNPDGTARWPIINPTNCPHELYNRCTQGISSAGEKYKHPEMKTQFPIPPDKTAFMGSYFNDAGVNLQYDFCEPHRQPETVAWIEYYRQEKPDGSLIFHCDGGSIISIVPYFVPVGYQHTIARLGGAVRSRLLQDGYSIGRLSWAALPQLARPFIDQINAAYFVCGTLPILCELPAGTREYPFSLDDLLDIGLITIEETLSFAHQDGLRPYECWEKVQHRLKKSEAEAARK